MDSVAAERAELERALEQVDRELRDVQERLADPEFCNKAKPSLFGEQQELRARLRERRERILANLATLTERRPGGLPSQQVGTWSPLPMYEAPRAPQHTEVDRAPQDAEADRGARQSPPTRPPTDDRVSMQSISAEIAAVLREHASEKWQIRDLNNLVSWAGDDVPTLRIILAALEGYRRPGLGNHVRALLEQLTGAPEPQLPRPEVEWIAARPIPEPALLPDARDGLNQMERRVLCAMWALGYRATDTARRTSRLVEELQLGDPSITAERVDATLAQLTHPWSRRNPLVSVTGSFCQLTALGDELFAELDETTDLEPGFNFKVPRVLQVRIPLLLAKGTDGVPPHNIASLISLAIGTLQFGPAHRRQVDCGPDFATGGVLADYPDALHDAAVGPVVVRGRMEWEQSRDARARLTVTELPWPLKPSEVAPLLEKLPGVSSSRAEADRVVVELEHVAHARNLSHMLSNGALIGRGFQVELAVNENGLATIIDLRTVIGRFLDVRRTAMKSRLAAELRSDQARAHLIEGLLVMSDFLDPVLKILRDAGEPADEVWALMHLASPALKSRAALAKHEQLSPEAMRSSARAWLARVRTEEPIHTDEPYSYDEGFSEAQARTILATRRPASLNREALLREWLELATKMAVPRSKLVDDAAIDELVQKQLVESRTRLFSARRTMEAHRRH